MIKRKTLKAALSACLVTGLIVPLNIQTAGKAQASETFEMNVSPVPKSIEQIDKGFPLNPKVGLVTEKGTDPAAIAELKQALKEAGVTTIVESDIKNPWLQAPVIIWLGEFSDPDELKTIKQYTAIDDLKMTKKEGYVVASKHGTKNKKHIVISGDDEAGTFYGTQTFKQIIIERKGTDWIPEVEIKDWPTMPIRGAIEGFYGTPWSHEDRLNQLKFYGEHKMNSYIYAPKDDPYHREKWKEPYPTEKIAEITELVNAAKENHVDFTFAISPGNSVTFSSDTDLQALIDKAEAMWNVGVRSFAIFLDDIDPSLRSSEDKAMFGKDKNPPAAAQAYLLNRFNDQFIKKHKGAERLITVPTDYSQAGTTPYRERFADLVQSDIIVQWTGIGVVAPTITNEDAEKTHGIFKHDLLIWDNYPVNDYDRNRLFLHPIVGRDANLTKHGVMGLTANPMNEAEASKIPLYTIADYAWNPEAYNPKKSWEQSLKEFGGYAWEALKTFAENSYSSQLNEGESPTLAPLIDQFWNDLQSGNVEDSKKELISEFKRLEAVPAKLRSNMDNQKFIEEVTPYLEKMEIYGKAGQAAVKMLAAQKNKDDLTARQQLEILEETMKQADKIPQKIGEGVLDAFLERARWGQNLAVNQTAKASNYWQNNPAFNAAKAFDGDVKTRWATGGGAKSAWLEISFPEEITVDQTVLRECKDFGDRIQKYEIQYWNGSSWVTVSSGNIPSAVQVDKFSPVVTNKLRLNIPSATFEPTVWEFSVYNTKGSRF